ncbi:hypothetical protein IST455A_00858 [Burkholderia multivorans]|nr:hypothetical protein IST419_00986 [Burkholderia multivorans]CAB5311066.1 hypothetical protein IST455A_00858 [Burkholderia multivorans]CAB5312324.1 hypothetical protein IST455B_00770 [Burkholderia multivorans]CAB5317371.1 hypothetical protein IST495B_01074 [Burkholderia multivorans]CAB5335843.1 hypothetical protein IST4119_01268 [Burkholderia multivorans]
MRRCRRRCNARIRKVALPRFGGALFFEGLGMAKDTLQTVDRPVQSTVTYLDTRFRSRVIVFPSGDVLHVFSGEAVATTAAQIEYLDAHPDFKRLEERE